VSYVRECQIKRLFHNIDSLNIYLMQYANQILLENEKCTQLTQMFWEKYPNFKNDCITSIFKSNKIENISNLPKYIQYDCESDFYKKNPKYEQLQIFNILKEHSMGLHISEGTPKSGKTLFY
jgi:hypothetical protein